MAVRKLEKFEALRYEASKIPVLEFKGSVSINNKDYYVAVGQGSDGSVSLNLTPDKEGSFNFVLCPRGLVAICYGGKYLSRQEFLEKTKMSASDISGLARILKRESKALFGLSAEHMQPCLNELKSVPFISQFRAVLQKKLEPLLEELKISRDHRHLIYAAAVFSYFQSERPSR